MDLSLPGYHWTEKRMVSYFPTRRPLAIHVEYGQGACGRRFPEHIFMDSWIACGPALASACTIREVRHVLKGSNKQWPSLVPRPSIEDLGTRLAEAYNSLYTKFTVQQKGQSNTGPQAAEHRTAVTICTCLLRAYWWHQPLMKEVTSMGPCLSTPPYMRHNGLFRMCHSSLQQQRETCQLLATQQLLSVSS